MPTVNFNTQLPGYEVLAELGRGNTRVLKARHLATGDLVAIKQYAFATDADTLRRFERESQIMTQIDHPNIVRVREMQLGAAMPYVVMDYVEGGDLRSLIRQQGFLDVPTTIRLGLQLMGAFRAMHPMQVIHRDIKPENILYRRLISGELHFLLTDFGIAKIRADDSTRTRTGQSLMTYEYAAPEQFDNPREVDEAADYYALGVVFYECLTGQVPFVLHNETGGLAQFMQQVLTAPLPNPVLQSGQPLPPSLFIMLTGLLTRNPQQRLRHPDQVELLLEQSRVEQLKANQTAGSPNPISAKQTIAGPAIPLAPPPLPPADEPAEEDVWADEKGGDKWTVWGVLGIVVAAGLAFLVYNGTFNSARPATTLPVDSVMQVPTDTMPTGTLPVTTTQPPESTSEVVDEEPTPDPSQQAPPDSATSNEALPDSAATAPSDTTE